MKRLSLLGWVALAVVVFWMAVAIAGPFFAPHPAGRIVGAPFMHLGEGYVLGTDYLGRDMLSRILYGARYTVGVALLGTVLACVLGVSLGLVAAVRGGLFDGVVSRAGDALIAIPHLMFALVVVAALGSSIGVLVLMLAISYTPGAYRIARALGQNINAMEFIQVARARGEGTGYILAAEVLPNMVLPVLTDFGLRFVFAVLLLSGLSFLGLGIQPPNADWGALVRENIEGIYEVAPAVIVPAIAIASLTVAVNLLIDATGGGARTDEAR